MPGARSACQPDAVQGGVEEVAGAIAREHAPGAVCSVGGGRQAKQHDARPRVAEARYRAPPVLLIAEGRATLTRDLLTPGDQTRAAPAADQALVELRKRPGGIDPAGGAPRPTRIRLR